MGKQILWIEDESDGPLVERKNRIEAKGFKLSIAENATIAENLIKENSFDLYIVDIRLKPGDDNKWLRYWGENHQRLGIQLLEVFAIKFKGDYSKIIIYTIEEWEDIEPLLNALKINIDKTNYLSKNNRNNLRELISLITKMTN